MATTNNPGGSRCFYCGQTRGSGSKEHVVPAHIGGRLVTRAVCQPCNHWAGQNIDEPFNDLIQVAIPKALNDVRHSRRAGQPASNAEIDGIDPTGKPVTLRFSPGTRSVVDEHGAPVKAEWVEISYGLAPEVWSALAAKVALGTLSKLADDDWLDSKLAIGLRTIMRGGRIDESLWPRPKGVMASPGELDEDHPIRHALGPDRHLLAVLRDDHDPTLSHVRLFLFGGEHVLYFTLPGYETIGPQPTWVLDYRPAAPPRQEDWGAAIERLLREQGWSDEQIDAAR